MNVLIFENNLIWSSRLAKTLTSLGHRATVLDPSSNAFPAADAAIINLSYPDPAGLITKLKGAGMFVIGHAGHKETRLIEAGKAAGCDRVASNSELTFKIEAILGERSEG